MAWLPPKLTSNYEIIVVNDGSLEESRYCLILTRDLGYGQTDLHKDSWAERHLMNACARTILASGFHIPPLFGGISKAKPLPSICLDPGACTVSLTLGKSNAGCAN
jgi:hypothetical protein